MAENNTKPKSAARWIFLSIFIIIGIIYVIVGGFHVTGTVPIP